MTQQEEDAHKIIERYANEGDDFSKAYLGTYHPPEDEQYERFKKFSDVWLNGFEDEALRVLFKHLKKTGILADPKDKVIALDEAIEEFKRKRWSFDPKFWDMVSKIRAKYTGETTK